MAHQFRPMRRLKAEEIREIISLHLKHIPHPEIATHTRTDLSTVKYHIAKHERLNPMGYREPVRRACTHPSLKCLICGTAQDHIHRRELEIIRDLTTKLERANSVLARHDLLTD